MPTQTGGVNLFQAVMTRAPTTIPAQDVAICTWHLDSGGDFWTATSAASVEALFDTFFNAVKANWQTYMTLDQYRWYVLDDSGQTDGLGAWRITDKNIVGTASGAPPPMPPQVAMTVTEKSASRRRWGRFYLPVGCVTLTSSGRWGSGIIDTVADAAEILYNAIRADTSDSLPNKNVVTKVRLDGSYEIVNSIQVDDLVDIQRRRRWDTAATRDVRTLV